MTFVLRQITKRAAGGEIVRQRDAGEGPLRIGRGADCDIRIPDLAVSIHHATLSLEGLNRVRVQAAGDQPFGVDGRFTKSAVVKVADRPEFSFGDHLLALSPGEGGKIVLTLTRVEAAPGQGEAVTSAQLIPPPKLLGKRRVAWTSFLTIAILSLILPVLAIYGAFGGWSHPRIDLDAQWSSGPLSKSHAFLEKDCQACHQKAFVAVRDDSCKACHSAGQSPEELKKTIARVTLAGSPDDPKLVADHAGLRRMLWGTPPPQGWGGRIVDYARKVFNKPATRCVTCHTEHVGDPLTDPARAKPTLLTAHSCGQCHADLSNRLKDTALVNAPDWRRHPELRPRLIASPGDLKTQRISMATGPADNNGLTFPHDRHLSPTGGPARMAITMGAGRRYGAPLQCANCHKPEDKGGNYQPVNMEDACSACHVIRPLPHGDEARLVSFFQGRGGPVSRSGPTMGRRRPGDPQVYSGVSASAAQRLRGVFSPGGACYGCHAVAAPTDGSMNYRVGPVKLADDYLTTGTFNHRIKDHVQRPDGAASCADCHKAAGSGQARDLLLPKLEVCAQCHGKDKARVPQAASADCGACHSYHAPTRPAPKPDDENHRGKGKAVISRSPAIRAPTWGWGQ